MDSLEFWTVAAANGITLDREQMDNMNRFHDELFKWNNRVNMISRQDVQNIYERHILHSLAILKYAQIPPKGRCMDIGTGGGFPGIPLKIALPELRMLLVDSIAKKLKTAGMFAQHTGLRHFEAKTIRAETLADEAQYRQAFDVITARAVAPLVQLVSWVRPLFKPDAQMILLKGGDLSVEIAEAQKKFSSLRVREAAIDIGGAPWFKEQEKKVLICTFEGEDDGYVAPIIGKVGADEGEQDSKTAQKAHGKPSSKRAFGNPPFGERQGGSGKSSGRAFGQTKGRSSGNSRMNTGRRKG